MRQSCFVTNELSSNTLQDDKHREKCKKVIVYLWKHRRAIQLRLSLDICGSCTESIVSHVLSERLSRSPLAWSERGLQKMAMLRVYAKNGGVVSSKDIRVSLSKEDAKIESATLRNGWSKYFNMIIPAFLSFP